MDIGINMFATDYSIRPDDLAKEVEARGFDSLWFPEHTHIPVSRRTPFPAGGDLPKQYWHSHDPFVSLMAAAAATTTLKVATGICLVIERDTLTMAKEVASLDYLSNGRFLFGIGGGWNVEEMENHGAEYKTRFKKLTEQCLAMKELWTKEEAEFHGEHVDFDPVWSWPKPAQTPHPPIYHGGYTEWTRQRVVDFCDGWLPIGFSQKAILSGFEDLRERAATAGRSMDDINVTVFGPKPEREVLEGYAEAGVDRCTLGLPSAGRDTVLPLLDTYAEFIDRS